MSYPGETASVSTAKPFATGELLRSLASEGLGVNGVFERELALARAAGVPAERLVFHANNESGWDSRFARQLGVGRIGIDNRYESKQPATIARHTGKIVSNLLRLNPAVEPYDAYAYRRAGQLDAMFGLPIETGDAEAADACCAIIPELEVLGLHVRPGSQVFDLMLYQRAIERGFAFARDLHQQRFAFPSANARQRVARQFRTWQRIRP